MKGSHMGLYAVVAVIAFVWFISTGAPSSGLLVLLLVIACPLMMFVMMRGMHGDGKSDDQHEHHRM